MDKKEIRTVTVIGANGVVGSKVTQLLAAKTCVKVFLVSRSKADSVHTINKISEELNSHPAVLDAMVACDYSSLSDCISESDWVFESVAEDLAIKLEVHSRINQAIGRGTIVSSGTSSYRIEDLAQAYSEEHRKQLFGTHFFNPPDALTLLELVRTKWSDVESGDVLHTFLTSVLRRSCIEVDDVNGFLANRIGALFLNEALLLAEQSEGRLGIERIDSVLGKFTGRKLSPVKTIDYIGLDVFAKMIENIHGDMDDALSPKVTPSSLKFLMDGGCIGRKAGKGYYQLKVETLQDRVLYALDLETLAYNPVKGYDLPFAKAMIALQQEGQYKQSFEVLAKSTDKEAILCKYLLLRYIAIACQITEEVAKDSVDVDVAMECGYNWLSPRKLVWLFGGSSGITSMIGTDELLQSALYGISIEMLDSFKAPFEEKDSALFPIHGKK